MGTEQFSARATVIEGGAPRDEPYAKLTAIKPDQFRKYETMTDRRIPVVVLNRID